MNRRRRRTDKTGANRRTFSLSAFGSKLIQKGGRFSDVVNPEDYYRPGRAWLQSAVAVVNVDVIFAQSRGGAAQLTRTVRQPAYGDVRLFEDHVQTAQHRLGGGDIIRQKSRQALAFLHVGLKREDVHSTLRQRKETLPQSARFVCDRYRKLLRLRHVT